MTTQQEINNQHADFINTEQDESSVVQSASYINKLDDVLEGLGKGEKPWFLTSAEIYQTVKNAVLSIPKGKELFDTSLRTVSTITHKINESTKLNVAFELDRSYELINELDSILAENLVVVDDGLDDLRGNLAGNLRNLITALVEHKNWAESYVAETKTATKDKVLTRYEQALNVLKDIASHIESKFPAVCSRVAAVVHATEAIATSIESKATSIKQAAENAYVQSVNTTKDTIKASQSKVESLAFGIVNYGLKTAQPYVHHTVELTVPYVNQVIGVSTPVVKPYLQPLVGKALHINETMKEHRLVGQYVSKANDLASHLLLETKAYCIPSTVELWAF